MQPSEITAQEIDNKGPHLSRETRDDSVRHFAIGADILAKAGIRGQEPFVSFRAAAGLARARAICRRHFPSRKGLATGLLFVPFL